MLRFDVMGPPQPKQRARKGKGGHWFTPEPTRRYETAVKSAAAEAIAQRRADLPPWPTDRRYRVTVWAVFGDNRRRDADNVGKAVLDALNGIAWKDDSQVEMLAVWRHVDRDNPHTAIAVEAA